MKMIIERIKHERLKRKFTQNQVARYLGMSQPQYSKIEQGKQEILAIDLAKLAQLYNVSFDDLLNDI